MPERALERADRACSEVPETGRHLDLVADRQTRSAIARLAGLVRLAASRGAVST